MKWTEWKFRVQAWGVFLVSLFLLPACGGKDEEGSNSKEPAKQKVEHLLKDFAIAYDGVQQHAVIDYVSNVMVVKGVEYRALATGISFVAGADVVMTPTQEVLLQKLDKKQTITFSDGKRDESYTLLLQDFKGITHPEMPKDPRWKLAWAEEFDGDKLDETIWSKTPRAKSDWNSKMSDADELFELREGKLVLRVLKNVFCPDDSLPFLTGGVWTKGKKNFTLGRIDVKARFDSGQGFWPAIWMMGKKGKWPDCGELDIMEHLNFDTFVYQTVHTSYTHTVSKTNPMAHGCKGIDTSRFNIYSVEVHSSEVVFLVNNVRTFVYPCLSPEVAGQYPFTEHDFYVILSAQMGGSWVGKPNLDHLPLEETFARQNG